MAEKHQVFEQVRNLKISSTPLAERQQKAKQLIGELFRHKQAQSECVKILADENIRLKLKHETSEQQMKTFQKEKHKVDGLKAEHKNRYNDLVADKKTLTDKLTAIDEHFNAVDRSLAA